MHRRLYFFIFIKVRGAFLQGTKFENKTTGKFIECISLKQTDADVAQLVEQLICNQLVGGSIPSIGSGNRRIQDLKVRSLKY